MQDFRAKIILVGPVGVGKSSLIRRFVFQMFSDLYLSTIGVRVDKKTIEVEGKQVHLLIWDLAGEIVNDKAYSNYLKGTDGIIGVFDLNRPQSYIDLQNILIAIQKEFPGLKSLVVGNKKDLIDESTDLRDLYDYDYLSSAKSGENVELIFEKLAEKVITSHETV